MSDETARIRVGERVTIYQRGKKGTYVADFWQGGEHRRQSLRTPNRKVAVARAMKIDLDLAAGTFSAPVPHTDPEAVVADYLAYLRTEGRARKTLVKYEGIFRVFLEFLKSQRVASLAQFSVSHFDRYRSHRRVDHHPKTLYVEGVVVKQLFKWAKSRRLIAENPVAEYRLCKPPLVPKSGPDLAQVDLMLSAMPEGKRAMIALLAFTGMRAGELQRLRPADIDLRGNWVHILSREGLETKTRTSRKVPIHERLRPYLSNLKLSGKPWFFTMPPSRQYPAGDHMVNIKKLNEEFQSRIKAAGMPTGRDAGFTLHSLRHFFETFTVNNRVPQRAVDAWLGHSADKSMAAVYYRLHDHESQNFMREVPFGAGEAAADAAEEVE